MLLLVVVVVVVLPGRARADIFVSGDMNIADGLNGFPDTPVDPGNQRFFTNVLAGDDKVVVHNDLIDFAIGPALAINGYYNTLPGVSSSMVGGTISNATFAGGVDLFFVLCPNRNYAPGELLAMNGFVAGGGSIFFLGDNGAVFTTYNNRINVALLALGSTMSIVNDNVDNGYHTATGSHIIADPYTTGVTTFTYALSSQVLPGTGKALFTGTGNEPFVAYVPEPTTLSLLLSITGLRLLSGRCRRR